MTDFAASFRNLATDFHAVVIQQLSKADLELSLKRAMDHAGRTAWQATQEGFLAQFDLPVEAAESAWQSFDRARLASETDTAETRMIAGKKVPKQQYFMEAQRLFWPAVVMPWVVHHHRDRLKDLPIYSAMRRSIGYSTFNSRHGRVTIDVSQVAAVDPVIDDTWPAVVSSALCHDYDPLHWVRASEDAASREIRQCAQDYVDACRVLADDVSKTVSKASIDTEDGGEQDRLLLEERMVGELAELRAQVGELEGKGQSLGHGKNDTSTRKTREEKGYSNRDLKLLQCAVACIEKYPGECRNRKGDLVAAKIIRQMIVAHDEGLWPDNMDIPLDTGRIERRVSELISLSRRQKAEARAKKAPPKRGI